MQHSPPVIIDDQLFSKVSKLIESQVDVSGFYVITDEHVHKHCIPKLIECFPKFQFFPTCVLPCGEQYKQIDTVISLWDWLIENDADRKSMILCVGGGVITDMAGFAAATFKRGIRFAHIPSTLLSMVDAAIGGKTGVDFGFLKNQIGTFSLPEWIYIQPEFLKTLSDDEIRSGFAECVKHALISGDTWQEICSWNEMKDVVPLLHEWVQVKQDIVKKDPTEKGERKKLNYGHSIGHAWESWQMEKKKHIPHGDCVAFGMMVENVIAAEKGVLSDTLCGEINNVLKRFFPVFTLEEIDVENMISLLKHDKKNEDGIFYFSLLASPGQVHYQQSVEEEVIFNALKKFR